MPSSARRKRYPLNQSPLYRLRGKGRFKDVVGVDWDAVPELLAADSYRVWLNPKQREIQAPVHWMAAVHKTIGDLLARIEVPDYVFSQKGRSYADNTRQHVGTHPVIKTDIHKFYPSVTREMVYRMFVQDFECAEDVADRFADICCYKQLHLPTGSPLSGRVAFFAARGLFDAISKLAVTAGCKLTIYVDDIALSGPNVPRTITVPIRHGYASSSGPQGYATKPQQVCRGRVPEKTAAKWPALDLDGCGPWRLRPGCRGSS